MEDIPPGVTAVLTESTTDVLSHVAIRARSQGVLLATCFDEAEWARLTAMKVCVDTVHATRGCKWISSKQCELGSVCLEGGVLGGERVGWGGVGWEEG
jgi:hypothetical protein